MVRLSEKGRHGLFRPLPAEVENSLLLEKLPSGVQKNLDGFLFSHSSKTLLIEERNGKMRLAFFSRSRSVTLSRSSGETLAAGGIESNRPVSYIWICDCLRAMFFLKPK